MIKLNEKDIKAVASARFYRKKLWWLIGSLFSLMGLFYGLTGSNLSLWISNIPLILLIVGFIWLGIGQGRAEKALVKDWKENGYNEDEYN